MPLFCRKDVTLHSGGKSDWIVDCAAGLTQGDYEGLATMAMLRLRRLGVRFTHTVGVPRGGVEFAMHMSRHCSPMEMDDYGHAQSHLLIVDDVFTTGSSMQEMRRIQGAGYDSVHGLVIFCRAALLLPEWCTAIWTTECPATGGESA